MADKTFHSITLPGVDPARVPDFAAEFNTGTSYAVKDYCTYNGVLYRCTTAHAAGAWNASHFTATNLDTEFDRKLDIPASSASAPANPRVGDLWIDNDENSPIYNVDAQPVAGSSNAVSSDGVKNQLDSLDARKANRNLFSGDYSSSATYEVDQIVMNGATMYRCNTRISTPEEWTAAHWTATNLNTELTRLREKEIDTLMIAEQFGDSESYEVGDYVFYLGDLYKCTINVDDTTVWNSSFWTKTAVADELQYLADNLNNIELDTTLSIEGMAADAAAVGNALSETNDDVDNLSDALTALSNRMTTVENFDSTVTTSLSEIRSQLNDVGYDVAFDEEAERLYLVDQAGERLGLGAAISVGIDGVSLATVTDEEENLYLVMYDGDDNELARTQIPAGGPGGGGSISSVSLTNVVKHTAVRNGADAIFSFTATSSDDTDITVRWSVDGTAITTTTNSSGSSFSFNAKAYLKASNSSVVQAYITNESGAIVSRKWTVTSTAFAISWGAAVNPIMLYTTNQDVYAVIDVQAQEGTTNIITISVGQHEAERTVIGTRSITVQLNAAWFAAGANTVTAQMVSSTDETDISEAISFIAIWGYGTLTPIVTFTEDTKTVVQYDTVELNYFVYDPQHEIASCSIQVNSETPRSMTASREMQTFRYVPQEDNDYVLTLTCGASSDTITLEITPSEYDIGMVTGDALQYNLDPTGHSNNDVDRELFGNLVFTKDTNNNTIFDWTNGGFQTDSVGASAFVIKKGYRVALPRSLFADADTNGKTIDISFRIVNSDQYDAVALSDLNNGETKGIILRANEGEIRLDSTTGQVFRYCEENRIDMSILVEGLTLQRVVTTWLDGIPSKVNPYTANMLTQSENAAVIGSDHCDIWIYAIRVYNSMLETKDMIQNYISLGSTTEEKIARYLKNNIYNSNGVITPESLHAAAPDLTIVEIETTRMTTGKKDPVPATIRIIDGTEVLELDIEDGTEYKVQGTSSVAYARSAYNLDIDFKKTGKTYKLSENAIPVNYLNIKVNVASSENANNSCAVDWYNTFQPYLISARSIAGVRDTVEGKPCAVFIKNTNSTAQWFSSQLVEPGDTILYIMGDLCNSKKNLAVFGQDGAGEHPTKGCIEVSGNDTEAQRFRATATYNVSDGEWQSTTIVDGETVTTTEYEWRMEPADDDLAEVVNSWNATVAWVASTINNSTKFKNEVSNYFAIDSLLFHFLYLEYFAAYDQVSKNTFYSYDWDETEQKYLWNICKAYDSDTILAYDNDGKPLGNYGLDYNDTLDGTVSGRTYFNAQDNPIWCNIQDAFYSELSTMYTQLRSNGAWDAQSIADKWNNYQAIRPHAAMVQDMYNKYILPYKTTGVIINGNTYGYDDNYIGRLAGSKIYQRKQFLTYQTDYMDGKYGYYSKSSSMQFRTNGASSRKSFTVKSYAKTYITVVADNNVAGRQKVGTGATATFSNVSVGSNTTLYVTPDRLVQYVRPLNETQNSTFNASGASKLMEVELGGETENTAWQSDSTVAAPSPILKKISIRNITNYVSALDLSANVELEEVDTRGTQTGRITLPKYAPLSTVRLNACTGITASNLNQVELFTLESGSNLTSVNIEDCNDVVTNAMLAYLNQAVNAGGNATRRIRMTNVDWDLQNINLLYTIATKWQGYNALGEEQITPVLTGTVHVDIWSQSKLTAIREVFGSGLNVIVDPNGEVSTYTVQFLNYNNDLIETQYIEQGSSPTNPTTVPTRPSTTELDYVHDGWSWSVDGALIDDLSNVTITTNSILYAHYSTTTRKYRVRWYNEGVLLQTSEVTVHEEAVYTGDIPTSINDGTYANYYLFTGWDKSTGNIVENIDVNAQYDHATVPDSGGLSDFSPEQLKALIGQEILSPTGENNDRISSGDEIDIVMGQDYNFNNVTAQELVSLSSPQTFTGSNYLKPQINGQDILLFNEAKDWTLAIDFSFDTSSAASGALVSSYQANGLRLEYNSGGRIKYGSSGTQQVSSNNIRQIVVLRKNAEDNQLYVYASNKNTDNITYAVLTQTSAITHTAPLVFGAQMASDGFVDNYGKGTIYWAKLWLDDLGDTVCRDIASWPRQTFTMVAVGSSTNAFRNFTRVDNNHYVNCAFLLKNLLEETHQMNTINQNLGGWKNMPLRTWLNNRIYNAFPIKWRQLMQTVYVRSTNGDGTSQTPSYSITDPPAEDKIWIPSYREVGFGNNSPYDGEADAPFNIFTNNTNRIKYLNFGSGSAHNWWLRSPNPPNSTDFWYVYSSGNSGSNSATNSNGIAPGFCI